MGTGYTWIKVDGKRVLEHRHVMEQYLGRKLTREEVIHHINEIKTDNKIENLMVVSLPEHSRIHSKMRGKYAIKRRQLREAQITQELAEKIKAEKCESLKHPEQWLTKEDVINAFGLTEEKIKFVMNLEKMSYIKIGRIVRYNPLIIADLLERVKFNTF